MGIQAGLGIHEHLNKPAKRKTKRQKNTNAETAANRNDDEYFSDTFDIDNNSQEFQGEISGDEIKLEASNFVPLKVGRIGNLDYIEMADGQIFEFSENAYATMDRLKKIHFAGDVLFEDKAELGHLKNLGQVQRFQYMTAKRHIENGNTVKFFHDFGEVDGQLPSLFVDDEGFPLLIGGNYGVKPEGVVN